MKNFGVLLLVVICLFSCKKDEEPVAIELAEITGIQYSVKSDVDVDQLAFAYNSIRVSDTLIIANIQDWDFSGTPYYKICSKSYNAWDTLLALVNDNSDKTPPTSTILINTLTSDEEIGIEISGNYYALYFDEDDDLGVNNELIRKLRVLYESMNGCN